MITSTTSDASRERPPRPAAIATARALTGLVAVGVLGQAVFAGQILSGSVWGWLHTVGAVLLVPLSLVSAAFCMVALRRAPGGVAVAWIGLALFVSLLIQATLGFTRALAVHVPLGVVIFGLTVYQQTLTRRFTTG